MLTLLFHDFYNELHKKVAHEFNKQVQIYLISS